jgi:hypothetical protein
VLMHVVLVAMEQPLQTLQLNTRLSDKSWVCEASRPYNKDGIYANTSFVFAAGR